MAQEVKSGTVEDGPAGGGGPAALLDQPQVEQGVQDAGAIHTTQRFDGRPGDRLAVGDNGQRFQGSRREPARVVQPQETLDVRGGLGGRDELDPLAQALQADAACSMLARPLVEDRGDHLFIPLESLGQVGHADGLRGDKEQGLKQGPQARSTRLRPRPIRRRYRRAGG